MHDTYPTKSMLESLEKMSNSIAIFPYEMSSDSLLLLVDLRSIENAFSTISSSLTLASSSPLVLMVAAVIYVSFLLAGKKRYFNY